MPLRIRTQIAQAAVHAAAARTAQRESSKRNASSISTLEWTQRAVAMRLRARGQAVGGGGVFGINADFSLAYGLRR